MVKVGDDLYGNVCLSSTWRTDHEGEAALHARANRLNLSGREGNSVSIATEMMKCDKYAWKSNAKCVAENIKATRLRSCDLSLPSD